MKNLLTYNLFESDSVAPNQFSLILSSWNPYLVPTKDLANRPMRGDYDNDMSLKTTGDVANKLSIDDAKWLAKTEHYYVSEELRTEWDWKSGWGSKTKDVKKVFKDVDFSVVTKDITLEYKIARGAPDVNKKGALVAVPVK